MTNIERWESRGRWFMSLWALFAVPTAVSVVAGGLHPANLAIAAAFTVWGGVWVWLWLRVVGRAHAAEVVGLLALTALLTLFSLLSPSPATSFLVFAFILAGCIFPLRQAVLAFAVLVALQIALSVIRLNDRATVFNILINNVLVGALGIGARLFWQSYRQLMAAREQLAHVAVTEERLRFARDLHDLLGQSLSVLVLKSELVARQLPEDTDQSVRNEVRDIAQVARKSLNEVREAVAGYRQASLQSEISSARTALRAAGIGLLVEDSAGFLPAEQDVVLAWCLREAVTNVVKHSGARKCEVRLSRADGTLRLEVSDDGSGTTNLDGGSGLAGMRERIEMAGGTIRVGSENGGGLRLQVSVPQPA